MDLDELLESVDIVDFISQYVHLEEKNGEHWGLSPFKNEKTPSFSVRRETGKFYDFSSGMGGNVLFFTEKYFDCPARDAIAKLREFIGDTQHEQHHSLSATKVCRQYIRKEAEKKEFTGTVLEDSYLDRFDHDIKKIQLWRNEGMSDESLKKFDVAYDAYSDRIVYPIRNEYGEIVNIGGRTLDPNWKEKKLRKYTYFQQWGTLSVIYGLFENMVDIAEKKEIILFEGAKSVILADSYGIHNCGAILTSHLNPNQLKLLIYLGVNIVFALDNDVDIRQDKNIARLKNYAKVEYIKDARGLLEEKDSPIDKGKEVFINLYNTRRRLL